MSSSANRFATIDSEPYRHKEWLVFREHILASDAYICQQCGKRKADGVVLQVHHNSYVEGKMPWEYPPTECFTLCKGCHASVHGHIKPKFGWHYLGDDDLGELCGNCEYCNTEIRYVYFIQHPNWEPLAVGTDCCDNLTGTKLASNKTESIQRYKSRQARFLKSPKWITSIRGLEIRHHDIDVAIANEKGQAQRAPDRQAGASLGSEVGQGLVDVWKWLEAYRVS